MIAASKVGVRHPLSALELAQSTCCMDDIVVTGASAYKRALPANLQERAMLLLKRLALRIAQYAETYRCLSGMQQCRS